jgi:signal transduction histidine kinase
MPVGEPGLALEPDRYLQIAAKEAESLGAARLTSGIDSTRFFLFRKAGDDKKVQLLLGDVSEEEEFRQKQLLDNRREIEKIAEGRRQKTALRLHDGVEDTQDAFFVFDALRNSSGQCRDFCWAYVNRAAAGIFEQSKFQIYLFSEARLIPHLSGLGDALFRAVDERQAYEDMHQIEVKRECVWLHRRVVPSGDGAVVTLRNVTAEKSIETALRQAAESARQSEHTKTTFLASMSHEIRTPLNGVLGLARMLADTDMSPLQRAYVNDIVLSGNILLALIGDILDLSKIEAQEMQLSPSPVSLPTIVVSVVSLFQGQAQERGIDLSSHIGSGVPETVLVDSLRLRQRREIHRRGACSDSRVRREAVGCL